MTEGEPFLRRWVRRKAEATRQSMPADRMPDQADDGPSAGAADRRKPAERREKGPPLPPLETLGADSDFSAFMARGVPREIRNAALRRLWQIDPALGTPDGMVEYGEDFTDAAKAKGLVRTAFRVGYGMRPGPEEAASANAEDRQLRPESGADDAATPAGSDNEEIALRGESPEEPRRS